MTAPAGASRSGEDRAYADDAQVLALVQRCITDAERNTARRDRDRQDWKNLLFERGGSDHQWVIWDNASSRFVPRGTNPDDGGLPDYIPRPVTNVYGQKIDGIAGLLNQSEPALQYAPGSDDEDDRATADVCEDALPVLREECGYDRGDRERLNRLSVLTNAAAYTVYFDPDPRHGTEDVELFQCQACAADGLLPADIAAAEYACPACGAPEEMIGLSLRPDATPNTKPLAKGKVCGDIAPSFEFSVPRSARSLDTTRMPWVLLHSRMAPEDVARRWEKGKRIAFDKSGWAFKSSVQRQYADAMRQLSSPLGAVGGGSASDFDGPVVYRLFHDPIDDPEFKFPRGLYAVVVNETVLDKGPLPLTDDQGAPVKNVIIRQFVPSVVSAHGKPPADDLVPIQEARNLAEAMLELTIMHDAAPTTFVPETVTLIDQLSGAPGATVRYRSLDGQKPERTRGMNPPEGLYTYIEKLDEKADELSKLNAVLAGARPEGDPTLGEIQILQERGMQAFREPIASLIRFETDLARLLLWVGKQSLWSPRMRKVRGENGQWELRQFAAADLAGQVDIQVEIASAWPKSPLMQQMKLKDAVNLGLIAPQQDPEAATKILNTWGLAEFKPSLSADLKHVARDLDRWKAAQTPDAIRPPDPLVWNLDLHLAWKLQFLKTEEAEELADQNPPVHQAMLAHVQQLQAAVTAKQMQAAAAAAGLAPGGGAPPGADVQQLVEAGVLSPAGAQPAAADPMAAAMAGGILQPAGAQPAPPPGPSVDDLINARLLTPVTAEEPPVAGGPLL